MSRQVTPLRSYWRSYYDINRQTYNLGPLAAAWDALKLTVKIRSHR